MSHKYQMIINWVQGYPLILSINFFHHHKYQCLFYEMEILEIIVIENVVHNISNKNMVKKEYKKNKK